MVKIQPEGLGDGIDATKPRPRDASDADVTSQGIFNTVRRIDRVVYWTAYRYYEYYAARDLKMLCNTCIP